MKKIVTVIGARPQFIKHAALQNELRKSFKEITVHTGQHYDENMSDIFFKEMGIKKPDYNLEVGSMSHAAQTGCMMERLEDVFLQTKPDMVIIYGDTNSTVAASLTASKMHIPVSHVEAGLRSFNMRMPEEINRIIADRLSDILFAPTKTSMKNLREENLKGILTGDVMLDAFLKYKSKADSIDIEDVILGLKEDSYAYMTLHRAENTLKGNLKKIINNISKIPMPVIFSVHPRTLKVIGELFQVKQNRIKNIHLIDPQGYFNNIALMSRSLLVITDSGGLQKEAYFAKKRIITVREETEWTETVDSGYNTLCPMAEEIHKKISFKRKPLYKNYYGDGDASIKISRRIKEYL
ncbi:TPA: UDP-N-acetylglucosamine 2-epimerase (non-hydrolyzing) [candidate division WOR-3 bacterium]|jgi:UDP-N-acetylglucosamine 2-epimerase|uniref:UDP-N-acetylglucosamine 2-epimerase (Non-hydrolyzing) n=1 Tax=candidate division WOR-3 bacterium TaxID=2052148 RepID=A0A350HAV3_UNCW3|nr:UDP-N-acetylglucosamine 2-epimerase (non-hydrolyzing) [candidate division WOR-3 bacterium]